MQLSVAYLDTVNSKTSMDDISSVLDKAERHAIQQIPWPEFSYKPEASFSIAHTGDCILLKYFIQEKTIRAVHYSDNSPVHEDSCVEFFVTFDNNEKYYNVEFNCIGACLFGFGKNRLQRELLDDDILRRIRRQVGIKVNQENNNLVNWELVAMIPVDVFAYHKILSLQKMQCRGNFYKCGDKLPEPHFLSWQDMKAIEPAFHLSEFFGNIYFK